MTKDKKEVVMLTKNAKAAVFAASIVLAVASAASATTRSVMPTESAGAAGAMAKQIDAKVELAMDRFAKEVKGSEALLQQAHGVLVFAGVVKAGLGIGGEYGEGALRIGGQTVDYYSIASGSIGLQFGAQKKDVIILFLESSALTKFRESSGWKAGVDGSVVLIDIGAGKTIDTQNVKAPIVGFVVGQKGLMYNLSLEGSKITKLKKD